MRLKKLIVPVLTSTFLLNVGAASALSIKAGPIYNQADAEQKCPEATKHYGGWNGQWRTIESGVMSVCGAVNGFTGSNPYNINVGPIWDNADAAQKCPSATQYYGGWTGNWITTVPGSMSMCGTNEIVNTDY
ncbi:mannan-binding lectin [Endozoicomonas sp. SM1973]|uniref:Mannan-binding lectin n=1 Tax=Spartinivicinus marinus TaxID=2994442 RepID=A0A853IAS6_9GAMM|nr:mannan-binding lectin [Spartinivicinus marinus]MCX4028591.1 mannan-binding lectin [Spartinivicinus marinus]NYZ67144.1 mannan-binding lectin [Spartinivicinus marinus]